MSIVELLYFEFTEYGEIVLGTIKKYVIDHIRMRLMNEFPGCLCQMWGFYERTIISVAFCKPIKVMIRRIAVVSEEKDAFGKRVRKVIKTHALIPNMVLPYFRYAITDQVLAISSGMDIPLKAGISDDEFMQHPDFLYAVSEVQHEKNLDRFYQDDGNADENLKKARRAASRQWHHMQSAKYRESIRRNLVKYEGCYLNDIPVVPVRDGYLGKWVYSGGDFSNTIHITEDINRKTAIYLYSLRQTALIRPMRIQRPALITRSPSWTLSKTGTGNARPCLNLRKLPREESFAF